MQQTGEVFGFPFGGCDVSTPAVQSVMPHASNNTYLLPPGEQFWLTCEQQGASRNLTFDVWQKAGFDAGSRQAATGDLTPILSMAAAMLGMSRPQPAVALA